MSATLSRAALKNIFIDETLLRQRGVKCGHRNLTFGDSAQKVSPRPRQPAFQHHIEVGRQTQQRQQQLILRGVVTLADKFGAHPRQIAGAVPIFLQRAQ